MEERARVLVTGASPAPRMRSGSPGVGRRPGRRDSSAWTPAGPQPLTGRHHDFGLMPVRSARAPGAEHDVPSRAAESGVVEAGHPDETTRLAQAPADAGAVPADAAPAAPARSATFSISGDGSYTDTATSSTKEVTFRATWSGGAKEDYIIVNWIKGSMKNAKGKPYRVRMFGAEVDYDFASWRVDSLDKDPAYWSSGGTRWNYTVDAADKFSATDSPGPMNDSDGKGASAKVDFKTAVYRSADVGTDVAGPTIAAKPITAFVPWTYHVDVLGGGKFSH